MVSRSSKILRSAVVAAAFGSVVAIAEPPRLLTMPAANDTEQKEMLLPIPYIATPEQQESFALVIAETRKNDVSVTDQAALMYAGLMKFQDEEYDESVSFLEESIRRDPTMQPAWEALGWAYVKTDQMPKTRKLWDYFQRLMPEQALPYSLLAQLAVLDYDWKKADANFKKYLEIDPGQFDIRYWYGQNLMRIGKADEAEGIFRQLLKEEPDRLDIQLDLAGLLIQRFEYDEAVEIYRHVNEELPDNPKLMLEQALLELRIGEVAKADEICLDVLEIEPENLEAMRLRADIAEINGLNDIEPLRQLIDETDDDIVRASLRVRLATRCHMANERKPGQYSQGMILNLLDDAIDEDPDNVAYKVLYAERLLQAQRYHAASSLAMEVLEKYNKSNVRAKNVLFEVALRKARYDDARQIISDRFGEFDSTDPMAHYYRARIYIAEGMYNDAIDELNKMEAAAEQGAVFSLCYTELTESDWTPVTSVRRLHEHIISLQQEGWILVAPTEIERLLAPPPGEIRHDVSEYEEPPKTAQFIDTIRWGITGERRFNKKNHDGDSLAKPKKYFTITFDGAMRSALILGNKVADDFGVPFGMFTPCSTSKEYVPSRAGWEELRKYAETGNWVIGSQLFKSFEKQPIDQEGLVLRPPLANRIWNEKKNRIESLNEWDRRMRNEFRASREALKEEMGEEDSIVPMVAYPFTDIGQEGACNLAALRNPTQSILAESARSYKLGFYESFSGYTVYGDNLLLCRRYTPSWTEEGSDIVRHAYENHPTFVVRKLRAELAMLMNKPHLANEMLNALRRDGYPRELCDQMETQLHAHFQNKPNRELKPLVTVDDYSDDGTNVVTESEVDTSDATAENKLTRPFIGAEVSHTKANDQIETFGYGVRAGLSFTDNTSFSAEASVTKIDQTVRPHWDAIVITNVPYGKSKYRFKAEMDRVKFTLSHRFDTGAVLSTALGWVKKKQRSNRSQLTDINLQDDFNSHKFTLDEDEDLITVTIGTIFHPLDNLKLSFLYDRDYVYSAVKNVDYHSGAASLLWLPRDYWEIDSKMQYWTYSDDNAMFNAHLKSMWELSRDLGMWGGINLYTVTTSEPHDFYWTPYWDQRVLGVLRYSQHREGYHLTLDFFAGIQKEEGRSDRMYENDVVVEEEEQRPDGTIRKTTKRDKGFYLQENQGIGWHKAWGLDAAFEKELTKNLSLTIEGNVIALREYIDHSLLIYLRLLY